MRRLGHLRVPLIWALLAVCATPGLGQRGIELGNNAYGTTMSDADYMRSHVDMFGLYPIWINSEFKHDAAGKQKPGAKPETASAFDLQASGKAWSEFEKGVECYNHKEPTKAAEHFKKAIKAYPQFVSAYNDLGLTYLQLEKEQLAQQQFEAAAKLDAHFAPAQLNLGRLAMGEKNYTAAERYYKQASALRPKDTEALATVVFLEHANHEYADAVVTASKVHSMPHKGMAVVHYIAGASLVQERQLDQAQLEYKTFLQEDPTSPLAPQARQIAAQITKYKSLLKEQGEQQAAESARLQQTLLSLDEGEPDCGNCEAPARSDPAETVVHPAMITAVKRDSAHPGAWVIRKWVDEVAMLFTVTDGGSLVNDLTLNEIEIQDNQSPPQRVLQFEQQSKLPLRVGVVIDTSGSVQPRYGFEKQAAKRFIRALLTEHDLGFVMGFATEPTVTQDFTSDQKQLAQGLEALSQGHEGTALWDAVTAACWKLATYPDKEQVARLLVVVTDGMDNASRTTLKNTILLADRAGVTLYVVSTMQEQSGPTSWGQNDVTMQVHDVLKQLAERTGGEAMFPGSAYGLEKTFRKLREVIRSRYLLAYKPANLTAKGGLHEVRIVARRQGKNLKVHARKEYYALALPGR